MFTLKLYRNGPMPGSGRTVIVECAGIWSDRCDSGVQYIQAFKKTVGVQDEDGPHEFYVGGDFKPEWQSDNPAAPPSAITPDNYYGWGVLENALGKTTEMIR